MERSKNSQPKLKIRKGDTVKVIAGESKGQQGKVLEVNLEKRKVLVERVNLVSKPQHTSNFQSAFQIGGSPRPKLPWGSR